jgi:hypothetical protein
MVDKINFISCRLKKLSTDTTAQAMVEYVMIVVVLIFGTMAAVDGIQLYEYDGGVVRIPGFKDAINIYLDQIYNLLNIMMP